jgi:hypothetical protein
LIMDRLSWVGSGISGFLTSRWNNNEHQA